MNEQNKINRAQEFAREAHKHLSSTSITGIKKPNIHHIQEVADFVWASGGSDNEIIAAWLHDSVEDTDVTLDDIEKQFGKEVSLIVEGLTDHIDFKYLQLTERKKLQAERIRNESISVRRVKIADQTSNVKGLAIDPVSDMSIEKCYQYICGAKLIADECKGISPLLDSLFDQVYQKGIEKFKIH